MSTVGTVCSRGAEAQVMASVTPAYPASACVLPAHPAATRLRTVYRIERVIATLALIVLAPVFLAIALVIVILSRRVPLVTHTRAGWQGATLRMLKFRTMW